MNIDVKDLERAVNYLKENNLSYAVTVHSNLTSVELSFEDKQLRDCKIVILEEDKKQVPRLIINCPLPKIESK